LIGKGKATHPASASASALLHPRCRFGCKEVPHSTWHNSNVDEEIFRRCIIPYNSSIYVGSLLSSKDKQLQNKNKNNWLRFNRIVTYDPV
jgi:hypothetical protein